MLTTSKRKERRLDMTLTMRMVDARHGTCQKASYNDFIIGLQQGQEEGFALGAYQKALETTRALLILGLSPEQIQFCTSLPMETIQTMAQEV